MKKTVLIILCVIMLGLVFPSSAQADFGPKPSVVIDFHGLDGEIYYATLLAREKSTGPWSNTGEYLRYKEGDKDFEIFKKFAAYKDADGFYFLQFFEECSETNQFIWSYFPPQEFKVLLYFPKTDSFITSGESYTRYAFDSYFTAKITGQSLDLTEISLAKSYDYTNEILSLLIRILLTIAIELLIALLFGFRWKRVLKVIIIVNIVTQITLNVMLNLVNYHMGSMAFIGCYILLEIAVCAIEAAVYVKYLQNTGSKRRLICYALVANAASFALGLLLAIHIPGIF